MPMEERLKAVLMKIYEAAENPDGFIPSVDIQLRGEERQSVIDKLTSLGFIEKVSPHGRTMVGCILTPEGRAFCESLLSQTDFE